MGRKNKNNKAQVVSKAEDNIDTFSKKRLLDMDEILWIVREEGLAQAVQHAISSREIPDPHLAKLWANAEEALRNLQNHIHSYEMSRK